MENILNRIEKVNGILNGFIWGPYMLVFFLLVGGMFTISVHTDRVLSDHTDPAVDGSDTSECF